MVPLGCQLAASRPAIAAPLHLLQRHCLTPGELAGELEKQLPVRLHHASPAGAQSRWPDLPRDELVTELRGYRITWLKEAARLRGPERRERGTRRGEWSHLVAISPLRGPQPRLPSTPPETLPNAWRAGWRT